MKALLDRPTSVEEAGAKVTKWEEHNSALETYNTVGGVMFAVGFAGLAGGLIWALVDDPTDDTPGEAPAVTLTPTDGGAFGQATWRF